MSNTTINTQPKTSGRRTNRNRGRGKQSNTSSAAIASPPPTVDDSGEKQNDGNDVEVKGDISTTEVTDEGATCWICAEPIKYFALPECNHRTCHVCCLRLRALYKNTDCTFCKDPQNTVIFTSSPSKDFSEFTLEALNLKDNKLSILFETQEISEEALILLRFNCPDSDCPFIAKGWNDLKMHVKVMHSKMMCDICVRFKKVFAHEHTLYTTNQLYSHVPSLSNRPQRNKVDGAHPLCEFCKDCFFGDDELYSHMRERHEECFVCKRNGIRDQYFKDYQSLDRHFTMDHYPCAQASCLEKKFVVFSSAMDLQAHLMEEHGTTMTVKDKKDVRRVVADLQFDDGMDRGGRRRRERDRDREPPPAQQSQPLDRRRAGFGAALTTGENTGSGSNAPAAPRPRSRSSSPSRASVDPVVAQKHAAFMARVSRLTLDSAAAEASIKAAIRSYRASESAARDLISTFYVVLNNNLESTQSLINLLVDLLESEDKKTELLQAWNSFKIEQQRQFPDLVPTSSGTGYAGVASGRVLNIKHSSATRSSSQSSRQVWDRVARAAASTSVPGAAPPPSRVNNVFATNSSAQRSGSSSSVAVPLFRQPQRITPWASSQSTSSGSTNVVPYISSSQSNGFGPPSTQTRTALPSSSFPALPTTTPRTKVPTSGNPSLRNIVGASGPATPAWGSGASTTQPSAGGVTGENEDADQGAPSDSKGKSKGKGKGKGKITLFTMGSLPG